jgi:hypothetical protein
MEISSVVSELQHADGHDIPCMLLFLELCTDNA